MGGWQLIRVRPDKARRCRRRSGPSSPALRAGATRDEAAAQAGFTANAFYYVRRGDPVFALAWAWAIDLSAADAHAAAPRRRRPARRGPRSPRTPTASCSAAPSAAPASTTAASASSSIISPAPRTPRPRPRRREFSCPPSPSIAASDPEFAAGCDEALAIAYAALEAEAVRQRLEAQRDLREGIAPTGEMPQEFDRVMRLLARYERKDGRIGLRTVGRGREAPLDLRRGDRRARQEAARARRPPRRRGCPRRTAPPPVRAMSEA